MTNYVKITEEEYKDLLINSLELQYLLIGGVDNWEWYGESLEGFSEEAKQIKKRSYSES